MDTQMRTIDKYIRVTDVLYPFSGLSKIDPVILKNAADRGTRVHEVCDVMISQFGFYDIDSTIIGYIDSFKAWTTDKDFAEKPERFFCDDLMLTGECDALYYEGDELILVDFKTPVKESKTWMLQASAYAHLARKAGYKIKRIEMVKLSKEGKEAKVFVYEENFELFLNCFNVYKYFYKNIEEENYLEYL